MEKKHNFFIEKNDCSNLEELIELTKTYYNDTDILKKEYLEWQYLNNPSGTPFLFTSREENTKELAGQYLVIPIKYNMNGKVVLGTLSLNTLTHPKYQRNGLFTKMANATYNDCEKNNVYFTTGFPNPNSYPGFVKKLNFNHLGDIPLLIKPLRLFSIAKSYFKKNKKKHGDLIKLSITQDSNIKEFNFFNKDLEEKYVVFWNKMKQRYALSTNKDFSFIKWRYHDIPTRKYKTFYFEEKGEIKGVIIIKAGQVWGFNAGIIMDIMHAEEDEYVGDRMIKYISKTSKKSKLDFIASLHSDSYEIKCLKKNNFYNLPQRILPQKIHFIVRKNKDFTNSDDIFISKKWKLSFGDYDVF